nr:ATP-binding cassette domain-containing protein [uncultured Hyphomonas sp.]
MRIDRFESFKAVQQATEEVLAYTEKWLSGENKSFLTDKDLLERLKRLNLALKSEVSEEQLLLDIRELAMGSRLASLGTQVQKIIQYYNDHLAPEVSILEGSASEELLKTTRSMISDLVESWVELLSQRRALSLEEIAKLPGLALEDISEPQARYFLEELRRTREAENEPGDSIKQPILRCVDMQFQRGAAFKLGPVNLEIHRGDVVACVGPNGSGKTTLLRLLAGSLRPTFGSVDIPSIQSTTPSKTRRYQAHWPRRRKVVAYTSQSPKTLAGRIDKSISFALAQAGVVGEANDVMTQIHIDRFRLVGKSSKKWNTLSQGEKTLARLAYSFAKQPDILILDEPLAPLDYLGVIQVTNDLRRIASGEFWLPPAIIISTHHLSELGWWADKVLFLQQGAPRILDATRGSDFVFEIVLAAKSDPSLMVEDLKRAGFLVHRLFERLIVKGASKSELWEQIRRHNSDVFEVLSVQNITKSAKRLFLEEIYKDLG